ncbi:MAG: hypothetical protein H6974_11565 [Gammaproteobacteria bacterium]|nr:hypothetical protein [Gammaproteobacteria bacterium]
MTEMTTFSARISLDPRWNRVPGISVQEDKITIDTAKYFYRYENPVWRMIEWETVLQYWPFLRETSEKSLEQCCLEFINCHSKITQNPSIVLQNAEKVYAFLFDEQRPDISDIPFLTSKLLTVLRETSTLMALNRVEADGHASNVGPAWFFPVCSQKVFDLTNDESDHVDELYHGGFYMESRRADATRAHTALGGRLVHGCQSKPNMAGGCVVSYGASLNGFYADLNSFRRQWIQAIRAW